MENWIALSLKFARDVSTRGESYLGESIHRSVLHTLFLQFLDQDTVVWEKREFVKMFHVDPDRVERFLSHPFMTRTIRYELKREGRGGKILLVFHLAQDITSLVCWEKDFISQKEPWIAIPSWLFLDTFLLYLTLEQAEKQRSHFYTQNLDTYRQNTYGVQRLFEKREQNLSYQKIQDKSGSSVIWEVHLPQPIEKYIRFLS